jgi:hypothetical protein
MHRSERRDHYFPASGNEVITERIRGRGFIAFQVDGQGRTSKFGWGETRLEAIADLADKIRIREAS